MLLNHLIAYHKKVATLQSQHHIRSIFIFLCAYLLLEMVSLEAALARPLTPAARAGSVLLLLDCVLNLPHVLGFKLAKKEDLGD